MGGWAKWVKGVKRYKLSVIKYIVMGVTYSMVTIVDNTVLHIWKLLRDLKKKEL